MSLIDLHCDTAFLMSVMQEPIKLRKNNLCVDLEKMKRADSMAQFFASFIQEPISNCILSLVFLGICALFTILGVKKGIEVANKIMMPTLALIMLGLLIFSLNLPNAYLGLEYMFKPDFSKISPQMFLDALGQALFTLSIGMGALLTYGSYIKEDKNIVASDLLRA